MGALRKAKVWSVVKMQILRVKCPYCDFYIEGPTMKELVPGDVEYCDSCKRGFKLGEIKE